MKSIIAYSTFSKIGYLFRAVAISQYDNALFHIVNHALCKTLIFLAPSAVLHAAYYQQDDRRLADE